MENYRKILSGRIVIELGDHIKEIEHIKGFIKLNKEPKMENIGSKNIILRESIIQITDWLIGMVIFTGEETAIAKNDKKTFPYISYEQCFLNRVIFVFVVFIIILSVVILFFIKLFYLYF